MNSRRTWQKTILLSLLSGALPLLAADPDIQAVKDFTARVSRYVKLQKSLESKLPPLPDKATPEQIAAHQKGLAAAIQQARAGAKPGDIFSPGEDYIRRTIAAQLQPTIPHNSAQEAIKVGNPKHEAPAPKPVPLAVNAEYPKSDPVSSVPPTLLLTLPQLPEPMKYRFVGKDLILHDSKADVIVDYLQKVVP